MKKHHLVWLVVGMLVLLAVAASRENQLESRSAGIHQELYRRIEILERNQQPPVGSVVAYVGTIIPVPEGWLVCTGQLMNSKQYPALFEAIGTLYGSGGGKTSEGLIADFQLPDLRGVFLRGVDAERGLDMDSTQRDAPSEGSRKAGVGSFQSYATALPKKKFGTSVDGNHDHSVKVSPPRNSFDDGFPSNELSDTYNLLLRKNPGGHNTAGGRDNTRGEPDVTPEGSKPMRVAGDHPHTVSAGGDQETRPVNVTVFYIVRAR